MERSLLEVTSYRGGSVRVGADDKLERITLASAQSGYKNVIRTK